MSTNRSPKLSLAGIVILLEEPIEPRRCNPLAGVPCEHDRAFRGDINALGCRSIDGPGPNGAWAFEFELSDSEAPGFYNRIAESILEIWKKHAEEHT